MKKFITTAIILTMYTMVTAQENWELPMVKDKILFDFTSSKMDGNTDLCEIYTNMDFLGAVMKKCGDLAINKSSGGATTPGVFGNRNTTLITPQLWGTTGTMMSLPKCNPGSPDTLIGSLKIMLETSKYFTGIKGGEITCMFRIILNDDYINMKLKGFEITAATNRNAGPFTKTVERETRSLEEEYSKMQTKKSEKEFWLEFKGVIEYFYKTVEDELSKRRGALDFDK